MSSQSALPQHCFWPYIGCCGFDGYLALPFGGLTADCSVPTAVAFIGAPQASLSGSLPSSIAIWEALGPTLVYLDLSGIELHAAGRQAGACWPRKASLSACPRSQEFAQHMLLAILSSACTHFASLGTTVWCAILRQVTIDRQGRGPHT